MQSHPLFRFVSPAIDLSCLLTSGLAAAARASGITLLLAVILNCCISASTCIAQEPASPAAGMISLLKSGRVPEARLGTIVTLVCSRGNAEDLGYLFLEASRADHWPVELRISALNGLLTATRERGLVPRGEHAALNDLLSATTPQLQLLAAQLAGEWKYEPGGRKLSELALAVNTSEPLRETALLSLLRIDRDATMRVLEQLTTATRPFPVRAAGIAVWARLDAAQAAAKGVRILQEAAPPDDPAPLVRAFLDVKGGTDLFAAELQKAVPTRDQARLLLREMLALGRSDAALLGVLSKSAGINSEPRTPSREELAALQEKVLAQGNPARGELIFRREDLSCLRCHALHRAGGQVGPDLSAVGSISPVEFLAASLLDPDQAIKEAFHTRLVVTNAGLIQQGIVHDRTADALVLKDATGKLITIPVKDIEEEIEGKSLMPKGLVNFMTDSEFVDLLAFLSKLGQPGPWGPRASQTIQRYRVLMDASPSLRDEFRTGNLLDMEKFDEARWAPAYALFDGRLPIAEMSRRSPGDAVILYGEIESAEAGDAELQVDFPPGTSLWLDSDPLEVRPRIQLKLEAGKHQLTARCEASSVAGKTLRITLEPVPRSAARCVVVAGE